MIKSLKCDSSSPAFASFITLYSTHLQKSATRTFFSSINAAKKFFFFIFHAPYNYMVNLRELPHRTLPRAEESRADEAEQLPPTPRNIREDSLAITRSSNSPRDNDSHTANLRYKASYEDLMISLITSAFSEASKIKALNGPEDWVEWNRKLNAHLGMADLCSTLTGDGPEPSR